ncbi:hypothetical protein HQ544_01005 [Candidatus Falkowbacteria bacterium]|nr:hypothetical protein [Candidatus Falkowbacteria bacterium]
MIRIIVDSQSNRLFRGVELEQNYDQRGGLCQVGEGDIVITTNPINPGYLDYWQGLGFSIPRLFTVGPFDPRYTLSELILRNEAVLGEISALTRSDLARLEFFCIGDAERRLALETGIQPYCNFEVSIPLSHKLAFKELCRDIGLPTAPWVVCKGVSDLSGEVMTFLGQGLEVLVKVDDGTGGVSCGGMVKVGDSADLTAAVPVVRGFGERFLVEELIHKVAEVSIHWEIDNRGNIRIIDLFNQLSRNFSYAGTSSPADLSCQIRDLIVSQLTETLGPFLVQNEALGFFCCDIIIDSSGGIHWVDFNPRKGAIIYIHDMAQRLSGIHFGGTSKYFWHEHCRFSEGGSFEYVRSKLSGLLTPSESNPFVVVTNPGVIQFGYLDITGISHKSKEEARDALGRARDMI